MCNRVGIEMPKIEIRFENLSVEADAYVGRRALPTLLNSAINAIEVRIPCQLFLYFLIHSSTSSSINHILG